MCCGEVSIEDGGWRIEKVVIDIKVDGDRCREVVYVEGESFNCRS